jgi:antitoxin (DNA-binding transcriptional repressor) of toxin-antitoxin stability system
VNCDETVITERGLPVARLVPIASASTIARLTEAGMIAAPMTRERPRAGAVRRPPVSAALAAAHRGHQLDEAQFENAKRTRSRFWGSMRPVELTETVEQLTVRLIAEHALRGADAVHLASALTITDPGLIVAAWDKRLRTGAAAELLAIAPASVP